MEEGDKSETALLQRILKSQIDDYERLQRKLATYDESDPKFVSITNSKIRVTKTILSIVSLLRDPRMAVVDDEIKRTKHDISSLIKKLKGMDKVPLMADKTRFYPVWGKRVKRKRKN